MISFQQWLATPAGQYVAAWECSEYDTIVADIFGYNSIQLGLPELDGLRMNRMPSRWVAGCGGAQGASVALISDCTALPFPEASLDLVLLPHTLELSGDAHATLREVERVLVPEGRVVITGFNPWGWWGWRQRRAAMTRRWGWGTAVEPPLSDWIGQRRLRDWLQLLGFVVEEGHYGCYRPPFDRKGWITGAAWMERLGPRWWPFLGSVYSIVAVKRVRGMRLLEPSWRRPVRQVGSKVSVANQMQPTERHGPQTTQP